VSVLIKLKRESKAAAALFPWIYHKNKARSVLSVLLLLLAAAKKVSFSDIRSVCEQQRKEI